MINLKKISKIPLSDKISIAVCLLMIAFLVVVMKKPLMSPIETPPLKQTTKADNSFSLKDIGSLAPLEEVFEKFSDGDQGDEEEKNIFDSDDVLYFEYPGSWMIIDSSILENNSSRFKTIFVASRMSISSQGSIIVSKISDTNNISVVESLIEKEIIENESLAVIETLESSDDFLLISIVENEEGGQQSSLQQKIVCSTIDCFIISFVMQNKKDDNLIKVREDVFASVKIKK